MLRMAVVFAEMADSFHGELVVLDAALTAGQPVARRRGAVLSPDSAAAMAHRLREFTQVAEWYDDAIGPGGRSEGSASTGR